LGWVILPFALKCLEFGLWLVSTEQNQRCQHPQQPQQQFSTQPSSLAESPGYPGAQDFTKIQIDRSWETNFYDNKPRFGELGSSLAGVVVSVVEDDDYDLCLSEHPKEQEFVMIEPGEDGY
jgi:hypothetical protein